MISPKARKTIAALGLDEEQVYGDLDPSLLLERVQVSPNNYNPKDCNDARLVAIANSIKTKGWVASELPLVWRDPEGDTAFTLINGEHRYWITVYAEFRCFPAVVAKSVTCREDAMALGMALEEATARRDKGKWAENLVALAVAGNDADLRDILRIKDPAALRQKQVAFAGKLQASAAAGGVSAAAPKLVSLTFTRTQYDAYQAALGNARTRLRQAQETVNMVAELADKEIVALAAMIRNGVT